VELIERSSSRRELGRVARCVEQLERYGATGRDLAARDGTTELEPQLRIAIGDDPRAGVG
jgi:hypothetical protein